MQLIILFVVLIFADGTVKTNADSYPTMEDCKRVEYSYYQQTPEVYSEAKVVSIFTECLNVIPRNVVPAAP